MDLHRCQSIPEKGDTINMIGYDYEQDWPETKFLYEFQLEDTNLESYRNEKMRKEKEADRSNMRKLGIMSYLFSWDGSIHSWWNTFATFPIRSHPKRLYDNNDTSMEIFFITNSELDVNLFTLPKYLFVWKLNQC